MNSQRPPCSCREGAAQSDPCAVAAPDQNSQAGPPLLQDVCPSCPCDAPQAPLGLPALSAGSGPCVEPVKIPGAEPVTLESPGMCVMRFPLQKSILAVELCPPESAGTAALPPEELCAPGSCLENRGRLCQELPAGQLCTLEVLEVGADGPCQARGASLGDPCVSQSGISMDPCASQSGISTDPCASQSGISTDPCASQSGISMDPCGSQSGISTDPCASQSGISTDLCGSQSGISTDPCTPQSQGAGDAGDAKDSRSQSSPRSPFRLNSCTSSIVERCLARCQSWFRAKK